MALSVGNQTPRHPGSGRRRARYTEKGRQVDPAAQEEIRALLADEPRRPDLLIEHLHKLQDRYGCLSARHLAALAAEMRLSMAEVYEVATFYAHFDVVMEGESPPPALTVRVCDSLTCECFGAPALLDALPAAAGADVRVVRAPCMGRCEEAPVAEVGHRHVTRASVDSILACIEGPDHAPVIPAYVDFETYVEGGGYRVLKECLSGARRVDDVIGALEDSGLKGKGGAGFPTGRKWRFVRAENGPRLMAVNADEGEPGTIKDRVYMEQDPHRFLEGTLIAGWAVEAAECYIYLRDEYPGIREVLLEEIAKLDAAGLTEQTALILRRGAGAYICGEESAMLESIEGKRGEPRHKPPFPSQVGLWGRPTLINNVETLHWVRDILERGPEWFSGEGRNGRSGFHSFSVSGRVKEPGVKLAPAGITMNELLEEHCGGMADGHTFPRLSAGRCLGRHPPRLDGRPPPRFRHPGEARLLHWLGRGCRALRPGRLEGRGTQPDALLRGRKLRTMHALPRRLREGGCHDERRPLGCAAPARAERCHGRRLDLRARAGGAESRALDPALLSGGARMSDVTRFTLDGRAVIAEPDETIWQVAKRNGIDIPHLCYTPEPGYRADGNCRACMVEIEGERVLAASCIRKPTEGMEVRASVERAVRARDMVMELLLADQPPAESSHDPSCELWDWAEAMERTTSRFPARQSPAPDLSHTAMAVNLDACIHCTRCVRACREVQVNDVIGMAGRGARNKIVFDFDDPMGESTCVACGECVQACPTGALMPAKEVGKEAPAKQVDSVCPYCGVGCQLTFNVKDNKILWVDGKDGPANHGRLCVKGRFGFDYVNHPHRLTTPLIRREDAPKSADIDIDPANPLTHFREASWDEALDRAADGLRHIRDRHGAGALGRLRLGQGLE